MNPEQEVEPDQVDTAITQLIDLVVKTTLHEEVAELADQIVKYRNKFVSQNNGRKRRVLKQTHQDDRI